MKKQIILLNGASSSGKSTLAPILQQQLERTLDQKYAVISIDDFISWPKDKIICEKDIYNASADMYKVALNTLKSCHGVIVEHVITSEKIYEQFTAVFAQHNIFLTEVTCPLRVLKERELARQDRYIGFAEMSYSELFPRCDYNITVDTYFTPASDCILKIIYNGLLQDELFEY